MGLSRLSPTLFTNKLLTNKTKRPVITFIVGTLIVQTLFLLTALYCKFGLENKLSKNLTSPESISNELSNEQIVKNIDEILTDDIASQVVRTTAYDTIEGEILTSKEDSYDTNEIELEQKINDQVDDPISLVSYYIKPGDSLGSIWTRFSKKPEGATLAASALKALSISPNKLKVGEEVELQLSGAGEITALKRSLSNGSKVVLDGDSFSGYHATLIEPRISVNTKIVSGAIYSSFSESAQRVGLDHALIDDFADMFGGRITFSRDIQAGDEFSLVYEEQVINDGEQVKTGEILGAALKSRGKFYAAVRTLGQNGKPHYYDETGQVLGSFFLRYPLKFTRISSMFSNSRFHPVLKRKRAHNGVDFAAPTGTPVRTVADGIVVEAGRKGGNGNMIKIKHSDRFTTAYLHLSKIYSGIRKGMKVKRGQKIGAVGSTGLATGPHLHFSMYDYGKYTDPLKVKLPRMSTTDEKISKELLESMILQLKESIDSTTLAYENSTTAQIKVG